MRKSSIGFRLFSTLSASSKNGVTLLVFINRLTRNQRNGRVILRHILIKEEQQENQKSDGKQNKKNGIKSYSER
jgi:hypothetical protein